MDLKLHYDGQPGYLQLVTPGVQPVEELDFGMLRLALGEEYTLTSADRETALVILSGVCDVTLAGERHERLGGRASVFAGRASGVYAPPNTELVVTGGEGGVEAAVCRAQAEGRFPARVVRPDDVAARDVGGAGHRRFVHDIVGSQVQAERLIVGETYTLAGNWSSYPPHKHDVEALPDEVRQEELYLYKIRPEGGFGIQYLYTYAESARGPLEQPLAVRENDVTMIPFGYHPVAAPPGYDVYYLWFMSGPVREMHPNDDPRHAWVKTAGDETREYPH